MPNTKLLPVALVSAFVGGGAAVGVVALTGVGGSDGATTTIVQQAPLGTGTPQSSGESAGLTPRELYERDAPGVVFIRAQVVQRTASPFDFGTPQTQQSVSTGSGFVIEDDGSILTNAHVIDGAVKVTRPVPGQEDRDGESRRQGRLVRPRAAEGRARRRST